METATIGSDPIRIAVFENGRSAFLGLQGWRVGCLIRSRSPGHLRNVFFLDIRSCVFVRGAELVGVFMVMQACVFLFANLKFL